MQQILNKKGILDYAGAVVSWICAIHCLGMPFLITALPFFGLGFLADETTELIIIFLSVALALCSFTPTFKKDGKYQSLLLFAVGIGLILLSHLFFEEKILLKTLFILPGAIFITTAHLINRRNCKNCRFQQS